jgi:quercetin dioxygenase-like cupin family protein
VLLARFSSESPFSQNIEPTMSEDSAVRPFSTPQSVSDLVEVQEGSVVSREVLKKKTGTVTLFAFGKGQGLSEHSTPHDALVQVLGGTVEITIGGTPHQVSGGEALLLPASIPHALSAVTSFKMLLIMIREPAP